MSKTVYLDPGHYSDHYNAGAAKGYYESLQMWKLHKYLKQALENKDIKVKVSRTDINDNPTLTARGSGAAGCDLFISLHSNAESTGTASRATVYYMVPHAGTTVDDRSLAAAVILAAEIESVMGISGMIESKKSDRDKDKNGKLDDNYYTVLDTSFKVGVPGLLIEHGFHTHKRTAEWLMSDDNLKKLAKAEAEAIEHYFAETDGAYTAPSNTGNKVIKTVAAEKFDKDIAGKYIVTAKSGLKLRTAPVDGNVIKIANHGDTVQCYGYYTRESGQDWILVVYCGSVGYMSGKYLSKR